MKSTFPYFSLNSVHDGDQNACFAVDQFIMAATSSATSGSKANNPWKFSACSVNEIDLWLDELKYVYFLLRLMTVLIGSIHFQMERRIVFLLIIFILPPTFRNHPA